MSNLYRVFRDLIPEPPLLIGTVVLAGSMQCEIELPDSSFVIGRGSSSLGSKVFVRNGVIEGAAPNLSVELIDI